MFSVLTETLLDKGKGIHAYRACAELGYQSAAKNPDAAASFFLLARSAELFVEMNERMPITAKEIDSAFARFEQNVRRLELAWKTESDEAKLEALNKTAQLVITDAA